MYGQGNYGPQTSQGPHQQHHLPTALPPPTSSQSLAAWNSVMHRPPATVPSQINQQILRGPPFQGPPAGMTNTTNLSHASLPQPPPVLGRMPITGPYRNSQHNLHYPLHLGTQNSHHFPTPSPPLLQGHPTYWHPVNLQPISVQGPPPIPNTPPPLPPLPPSQLPLPHASSSTGPPSPPFCRPLLPASSMSNISSSELALDVSGQRNDKVVTSEGRAVESLGKWYGSISALDRSTALEIDIHPAPPKPADEKIMKRIETLCLFIAKNGPGFEDMARTRESANPEFKFLFGGEPGSDAAVAHEYYRWAKKRYTFGDKLQEGALSVRPSEAGISVQTKQFIVTSVVHPSSDSDMEMEDDITQVDMDQEMERPVEYYRPDSDLVLYDRDGKEPPMPQIVQCGSAQDVSCDKVPFSEVPGRSDYGHQGTIYNAACLEAFARSNSLRSLGTGSHENCTSEKETGGEKLRPYSTSEQVDEFGRLVRKGASDSDSDDSLYAGRCHKKRERSRSRSQSPVGRRNRRRRSLQWARDRRNRSRSLEAEPCSGSSSVVYKKRQRKMKPKNRNDLDLKMYDENSFPEKNSPVNVIIALPPSDSISALENSTAQPCNESDPLPAKYSKRKKKRREKRLKRKEARNNSAGVPFAVLQNIKEKRKKKRIKRRVQEREAKAREKVSGKSNLLGDIPNNVSQVADLDESVMKEFSSTFGKQSDIERGEVHGEAHTKETSNIEREGHGEAHAKETSFYSDDARISDLSDGKPEQVEERIQATSAQAPMGIFDFFLSLSRI